MSSSGSSLFNVITPLAFLLDFFCLLCHFSLVPQIVRLSTKASPTWDAQFTHSVNSYFDAQLQLMNYRSSSIVPCMKEYLELRRSLYGFGMALDLLELAENMILPSIMMNAYVREKMAHLKQLALDIISCSLVRARNSFPDIKLLISP